MTRPTRCGPGGAARRPRTRVTTASSRSSKWSAISRTRAADVGEQADALRGDRGPDLGRLGDPLDQLLDLDRWRAGDPRLRSAVSESSAAMIASVTSGLEIASRQRRAGDRHARSPRRRPRSRARARSPGSRPGSRARGRPPPRRFALRPASIPVAPATARTPRAPAPSSRGSGCRESAALVVLGGASRRVYSACLRRSGVRTAVISDLHLGAGSGVDMLRHAPIRDRLAEALDGVDRLVLLGDVIELRDRPLHESLERAAPALAAIGEAASERRADRRRRQPRSPPDRTVAGAASARSGDRRSASSSAARSRRAARFDDARRAPRQARRRLRLSRHLARRGCLRDCTATTSIAT